MIVMRGALLATSMVMLSIAPGVYAQEQPESRWQNWDVTIGAGALYEPVSPGIDEYEVGVLPYVDIVYRDRFFLKSERGLGAYLFMSEQEPEVAFGLALGYEGGRDEDDASEQLDGLGDLDATAEIIAFAEGELGPFELELELAQGLGGHEGFTAELGAGIERPIGNRLMVGAGPFIRYADDQYMESFYGITAVQADRSTRYTDAYDAGGGFESAGFGVNAAFAVTDHWSVLGSAEYTQLLGDAADSPIVDDEGFMTFGAAVVYRF